MKEVPQRPPEQPINLGGNEPIKVSPQAIAAIVRAIKFVLYMGIFGTALFPFFDGWQRVAAALILSIFYDAIIRLKK